MIDSGDEAGGLVVVWFVVDGYRDMVVSETMRRMAPCLAVVLFSVFG